jgi:hydrogenase nickel incorporation protein HypA/HybF
MRNAMHELSAVVSILRIAEEESQRRGGVRVLAIHLKLGELAGFDQTALASAFLIAREGSAFAGTRLVVEEVPMTIFCPKCEREVRAVAPQLLQCADCGMPASDVVCGREFEVVALEVET